ncbi:hypothetical protein HMPREF1222_01936 [Treponema vincentii F0403]|uniref:Uncharacterized protein n=1 Tax=Treponema vincentii F0403 TaxID=1125702 RepID=S3MBK9_9SPIR|nr:hypothetical protein [Treponema vincentii]EPF46414.1 hypothetical protein HMPREF1222_01936 [Treponema vincentii F0403]
MERRRYCHAFDRTLKGKAILDLWLKRWQKMEIKVVFHEDKDNLLYSTYEIMKMEGVYDEQKHE